MIFGNPLYFIEKIAFLAWIANFDFADDHIWVGVNKIPNTACITVPRVR